MDLSNHFTVASARSFIDNGMLPIDGGVYWNNWVPIKLNIFIWRLRLKGCLLEQIFLMLDSILCPFCSTSVESIDHLFLGCSELIDLWTRVAI